MHPHVVLALFSLLELLNQQRVHVPGRDRVTADLMRRPFAVNSIKQRTTTNTREFVSGIYSYRIVRVKLLINVRRQRFHEVNDCGLACVICPAFSSDISKRLTRRRGSPERDGASRETYKRIAAAGSSRS
jgi:hypothetical protein